MSGKLGRPPPHFSACQPAFFSGAWLQCDKPIAGALLLRAAAIFC
jgi:hypothetical protein